MSFKWMYLVINGLLIIALLNTICHIALTKTSRHFLSLISSFLLAAWPAGYLHLQPLFSRIVMDFLVREE